MKRLLLFGSIFLFIILSGCKRDNESPIIEGLENIKYNFDLGSDLPNWLEGVTAKDNVDGDLTHLLQSKSNINMNKVGHYLVSYYVNDKAGNTRVTTINVTVLDLYGPTISGFSDIIMDLNSSTKPNFLGNVTSRDSFDGDLTHLLTVDDSNVNYSLPGDYRVYYHVADSHGNSKQVEITLSIRKLGSRLNPIERSTSFTISGKHSLYGNYKINMKVNDVRKEEHLVLYISLELVDIDEQNIEYKQNGFSNWDAFKLLSYSGEYYNTTMTQNALSDCKLYKGTICTIELLYDVNHNEQYILMYQDKWFFIEENQAEVIPPTHFIGYGMNVLKSNQINYQEIKFETPIFNESWFSTRILHHSNIKSSSTGFTNGTMFETLRYEPSILYNQLVSYNDTDGLREDFRGFESWVESERNVFNKGYYYLLNSSLEQSRVYYEDYGVPSTYWDYLNEEFLYDLSLVDISYMSYEDFFNKYGTHIIANGIFGGKINVTCAAFSDVFEKVNESVCSNLANSGLKHREGGLNNLDTPMHLNTYLSINSIGGNFVYTGVERFSEDYSNWVESFDELENLKLIKFGDRGLFPLWAVLPPTYEHLQKPMKAKFIEMYNVNYNANLKDDFLF